MYFYFLESSKVIYFWQHWSKIRAAPPPTDRLSLHLNRWM